MESRGSTKGTQTEGGSVEGGSQHPGGEEIHYFSRSPGTIGVLADASRRIEEIANGNRSQQLYPRLPVLVRSPSYPDFGLQDIITGIPKPGHVSPVRRFFALFVIFDLLFCTIMWLICIMITGAKIQEGMKKEVYNYSIKTSLFDLVMSSSSRFVILILFYVLICLEHWWPVAVTTAGSSALILAKVFLYQWTQHPTYMFEVIFLLLSFILPWGQAWFLDFRVLPLEQRAAAVLSSLGLGAGEREPLIQQGNASLLRFSQSRHVHAYPTESIATFYSPMESPAGSDDEGEMPYKKQRYSSKGKMGFSVQEREWREQGDKTLESGWAVMKRNDWCLEDTSSIGDTVQSLTLAGSRKAYRITGWINASPRKICEELFYNSEEIPKWNLSVRSCHVVEIVDEFTDIGHHVASDGGAGLIKTRDFVTLRRWAVKEGSYVIASSSVSHPQMPPLPNFVRGEILLSVMSLTASEGGEPGAVFSWALATDLKGWIPGKLVDQALSSSMLEYLSYLRIHIGRLKEKGLLRTDTSPR